MTPTPNLGCFWIIFEGVISNLASNKAVLHGIEQNSAMASQKLEEKVQPQDEDAESSKTGCWSPSRAHGKTYEQVPALICDSYTCCSLHAAAIWGGILLPSANPPPQIFGGRNLNLLADIVSSPNFHHPLSIITEFEREPQREAAVSFRTVVTFVT